MSDQNMASQYHGEWRNLFEVNCVYPSPILLLPSAWHFISCCHFLFSLEIDRKPKLKNNFSEPSFFENPRQCMQMQNKLVVYSKKNKHCALKSSHKASYIKRKHLQYCRYSSCVSLFFCSLLREHSIDGTGWAPTRTLKVKCNFFFSRISFSLFLLCNWTLGSSSVFYLWARGSIQVLLQRCGSKVWWKVQFADVGSACLTRIGLYDEKQFGPF